MRGVQWFYASTVLLYVQLLVPVVEEGVCPKSSHQIPRDDLSTLTLFRQLRCVCLVLFLTYLWPTGTKHSQTNPKGTFWESFLCENRPHSHSPFELFPKWVLAFAGWGPLYF